MPRSKLTGTQKKAQKKEAKFVGKLQDAYLRQLKRQEGYQTPAIKEAHKILKGMYGPKESLKDLMDQFRQTQGFASEYFEPIKQEALSRFSQETRPNIVGQLGQGTAGSSALNQALAAARTNLERGLASDFAGLQMNLGQNFLNQAQQAAVQNLNARLQGAGLQLGRAVTPQISGLGSMSPYMTKGQQEPSLLSGILGGASQGAGAAAMAALLA